MSKLLLRYILKKKSIEKSSLYNLPLCLLFHERFFRDSIHEIVWYAFFLHGRQPRCSRKWNSICAVLKTHWSLFSIFSLLYFLCNLLKKISVFWCKHFVIKLTSLKTKLKENFFFLNDFMSKQSPLVNNKSEQSLSANYLATHIDHILPHSKLRGKAYVEIWAKKRQNRLLRMNRTTFTFCYSLNQYLKWRKVADWNAIN